MSTKSLNERLTIQFGESRKKVYNDFIDIVKTEDIPKSTAGYLLLEKGILHRNNPEPLIKEVEKKVYVDRPVEKIVYRDRPKIIDAPKATQKAHNEIIKAMEEKEDPKEEENLSKGSNAGKWIGGSLLVGVIGYCLYKIFTV